MIITGWAASSVSPAYDGPAITDWRTLTQVAMFVILGVSMAAIPGGAPRSARRRSTAGMQA